MDSLKSQCLHTNVMSGADHVFFSLDFIIISDIIVFKI